MKIGGGDVANLFHHLLHSASHHRTPAVAGSVLGITGLIFLALKDAKTLGGLLPSLTHHDSSDEEKPCFVAGLQNLGNNCFLNVVLQALASCASFNQFLQSVLKERNSIFGEVDDGIENMPLTVALASLFKDLCIPQGERMILSPRRVMFAMHDYIPSFNLTRQQDAEEAFLHLLSSIKEEISECYVPHYSSLADIATFSLCQKFISRKEGQSERDRWQRFLLGPFDGVLCSLLACRSCSSQLSMDFEFFHSLPISPVLDSSETIMKGCSVQDCLKQFTVAELIENYRCSRCWHNKATKYLSTIGDETQIEKLKCCIKEDSCDCRNLFPRDGILWSTDSSHTIKRLCITRPPKILCIHLQRASANKCGELVKLEGHISFPMILDLFPFTKDAMEVGIEIFDGNVGITEVQQHQPPIPRFNHLNMQFDRQMLRRMYRPKDEHIVLEAVVEDKLECSIYESPGDEAFNGEFDIHHSEICFSREFRNSPQRSDNKINKICGVVPPRSYMYKLVSVVEHFGRVGSGHYTVYRRVGDVSNEDSLERSNPVQWFCVSDSEVFTVSDKDVLAAEASLLFYERTEVSSLLPTVI